MSKIGIVRVAGGPGNCSPPSEQHHPERMTGPPCEGCLDRLESDQTVQPASGNDANCGGRRPWLPTRRGSSW